MHICICMYVCIFSVWYIERWSINTGEFGGRLCYFILLYFIETWSYLGFIASLWLTTFQVQRLQACACGETIWVRRTESWTLAEDEMCHTACWNAALPSFPLLSSEQAMHISVLRKTLFLFWFSSRNCTGAA